MSSRRLRVMMSTPALRATTNPYIVQLVHSVGREVDVSLFSWRRAIIGRYDVLHVHWPEIFTSASSTPKRWARRLLVAALQCRLALTRTALVRTAHNERPHESTTSVDGRILRRWDRLTTLWIVLNERTTTASPAPTAFIPHGHYRDHFASFDHHDPTADLVSVVGHIRPYKGVEDLVAAVADDPHPDGFRLHVAGKPADPSLRALLLHSAGGSSRIDLELDFIDDARIVEVISSSALVVLPYRNLHNSGVALLALSLDRPVLVPDNAVTRDLQAEVGAEWVHLLRDDVELIGAIRVALAQGIPAGRPDLSAREWPVTAHQHADAYLRAQRIRRERR
ncbi:glycosyl transferase [Microbacterium sp. 1.5R]|uniref:glycosyl transferase n=1 Tax=Microbacterium sp. 1.5R TaxID=1916917 RepID=UPI0011A2A44E|nr:glycosyl transferase [Microbacterium sp. 1.5R]